jgi:hypothetical protein
MLGVVVRWSAIIIASFIVKTVVYLMVHVIGRLWSAAKAQRRQLVIPAHVHKEAGLLSLLKTE